MVWPTVSLLFDAHNSGVNNFVEGFCSQGGDGKSPDFIHWGLTTTTPGMSMAVRFEVSVQVTTFNP